MKYLDKLAQEATERKDFTLREVIILACLFPFMSAMFTFGGAHPLYRAFSDPASDHVGPWIGVVCVGGFWLATLWYWVWAVRWYVQRKHNQQNQTNDTEAGQ